MMIQSVWKNLTGLQKAAEHLWCDFTVFYNRYDSFSNTFNHFPKLWTQLAQHPSV